MRGSASLTSLRRRVWSVSAEADPGIVVQVREQLLNPYYHQWLRDTEELLEKLPWSLEAPEQSMALTLTFERWLLQLKVGPAISPVLQCSKYIAVLSSAYLLRPYGGLDQDGSP